jgi:N-acetylneuraminic acid mutarotase
MRNSGTVLRALLVGTLAIAVVAIPSTSTDHVFGQGGTWTTKTPMPTARGWPGGGVVNGILYAVGGFNGTWLNTVEAYNPLTNTWTTETPMPTARHTPGVGVVNGILYAVGGFNGTSTWLNTVEAYDPLTNTWTTKTPMPTARYNLAVGVVNGILYAVGGLTSTWLNAVEAYDPLTNTWTPKAPMPTARAGPSVGVVNGILYAVGGYNGAWLNTVEAYDPLTNTWTPKSPMPTARVNLAVGVVNGILYAVGGSNGTNPNLNTVEAYDPATNTWTTVSPMPTARSGLAAGVVIGTLYAVGGYNGTFLATNEAFTPTLESTPGKVTGGGFIQPDGTMTPAILLIQGGFNASVGDKATFGFVVQFAAGAPSPTGNLQYTDHGANVTITAISFTLLNISVGVCGANTHAKIQGSATVTGPLGVPSTQDFDVEVDDCASGPDTFQITTTGPTLYTAIGPVIGGNITIRKQ